MTCPQTRDVGALVLDLLESSEAARLEEHARSCPECSEALADLRPVAALMERADPPSPVPDELAFRRFQAAARPRGTTRWRLASAAAAVVLLLGTGVAVVSLRHDGGGTTVTAVAGAVHAEALLRPAGGGTHLQLRLRGVDPGERCQLVAVALDGHREVAGSWLADYAGTATVQGEVSLQRNEIARLAVETLDGKTLVTMRLA